MLSILRSERDELRKISEWYQELTIVKDELVMERDRARDMLETSQQRVTDMTMKRDDHRQKHLGHTRPLRTGYQQGLTWILHACVEFLRFYWKVREGLGDRR